MPDAHDPDATGAYRPDTPTPQPAERFATGDLLAGRYRVVAPLGKGGMGEVYRADDLTLGQPVALKFLPATVAADPDRLARFRKEVARARRVSHPNVCRVYDITELGEPGPPTAGTVAFLTMEFVDGEDLASVIKRLGRVPEEKGVEVARQLCSALAAVHDQGLLHRDLKPANVMLDGRGKVRLADFGLAAAAHDLSATEVRSGTPLYQAPEQLAGKEVTVRSDLFALGLVLYELFTGRRAYADAKRDTPPSKPSSHVSHLNAAVERVILRCLEPDPADRPRSAAEVLAGLPGGDPLAAALAAGETPSPQLVADAGGVGLIRPWAAVALLAGVIACLAVVAALTDAARARLRPTPAPDRQAATARAVLAGLGYSRPPKDRSFQYEVDQQLSDLDRQLTFLYRESPGWLAATRSAGILGDSGRVTSDDPPPTQPGMIEVRLDRAGRVLSLSAVPEGGAGDRPTAPDWAALFVAAGLDLQRFDPIAPELVPPHPFDHWRAWQGEAPDRPGGLLRVEAASWRGRPVWFRTRHADGPGRHPAAEDDAPAWFWVFVGLTLGGGAILAGRNLARRRVDRAGAARLGVVLFAAGLLGWAVNAHHVPVFNPETKLFMGAVGRAAFDAGGAVVFYLAVEPYLRRRRPAWLTGLGRVLAGRWRDPGVGRDVLVGVFAGVAAATVLRGVAALRAALGWALPAGTGSPQPVAFGVVSDSDDLVMPLLLALLDATLVFIFFLLLRKPRLYLLAAGGLFALRYAGGPGVFLLPAASMVAGLVAAVAIGAGWLFVLTRYGIWATAAAHFALKVGLRPGLTWDVSAWYFWAGVGVVAALIGLAAAGAYTATGGRLFKEGFFGDD